MNLGQEFRELNALLGEGINAIGRSLAIVVNPKYRVPPRRRLGPRLSQDVSERDQTHRNVRVLLLRGFFAPRYAPVYRPLRRHLEAVGMEVHQPRYLWGRYHFGDFEQLLRELEKFICSHEFDVVVGHSLGGIMALWVAVHIGVPVVALGPPARHIPGEGLQTIGERFGLPNFRQRWKIDALITGLSPPPPTPILVVSGRKDVVAPLRTNYLEGIPHIDVQGNHCSMLEQPKLAKAVIEFVHEHVTQPRRHRSRAAA